MDIVRQVETDLYQYTELLHSSPQLNLGARDVSLEISEADKVVLLLRQMPQNIRLHIQLHGQSDTFEQVKNTVRMVQHPGFCAGGSSRLNGSGYPLSVPAPPQFQSVGKGVKPPKWRISLQSVQNIGITLG